MKAAQQLRTSVVDLIMSHVTELQTLESCLPFLLEKEIGQQYTSLCHRIEQMRNSSEYVGELEILALAHVTKTQICFHQQSSGNNYCLLAKLPLHCSSWSQMNLCYQMDTNVHPGHFDLLIVSNNSATITTPAAGQLDLEVNVDFVDLTKRSFGVPSSETNKCQERNQHTDSVSTNDHENPLTMPSSIRDRSESSLRSHSQSTREPTEDITGEDETRSKDPKPDELYKGIKLSDADKFSWLKNAGKDKYGKRRVKCIICADALLISKQLSKSHRIPPIADGCRYNSKVVIDHAQSSIHRAATEATADKRLFDQRSQDHPWIAMCSKMNRALFEKMSVFAYDVYNDAQTGTLSAWSWPSRHLARSASAEFISSKTPVADFSPSFADIQYLNPDTHRELLHAIADIGRQDLISELSTALAVSLSYDGSVDAYQEDSKYVGIKYVTVTGELKVKFLGSAEPSQRGVAGAVGAIKSVIETSKWNCMDAFKTICGFTTDGESLNTGQKNGLWTKLQEQCSLRIIFVWCACHRSSLAFRSLFKSVDEAARVLQSCKSVATFFRTSGIRSLELSRIAQSIDLQLLRFPEHKEVRMTEFTANLFRVVMRNLPACLQYWKQRSEDRAETDADRNQMRGFLHTWTDIDKLKLLHLLLDCCEVVQRLQKRLQYTFAALEDVAVVKSWCLAILNCMIANPTAGGNEEQFLSSVITDSHEPGRWNGFDLSSKYHRRAASAHSFTSVSGRSYDAVRQEIIMSLINFTDTRLDSGELADFLSVLFSPKSWIERVNDDDFVELFGRDKMIDFHKFVPDLNLTILLSDFTFLKSAFKNDKHAMTSLTSSTTEPVVDSSESDPAVDKLTLVKYAVRVNVPTYAVACARIASVFPHSMYVERLVSSHNLIKSDIRSSMDRTTVNDYLFVKESMGPVAKFDPRPAIANWLSVRQRRPKNSNDDCKVDKYKQRSFVNKFFFR